MFDSSFDGKDASIFKDRIERHQNLYFIVIDSEDNVFGHFHGDVIFEIDGNANRSMFLFTLNSNGRSGVNKFPPNAATNYYTSIYEKNNNNFYDCNCNNFSNDVHYFYAVSKADHCSWIRGGVTGGFGGINRNTLIGKCGFFTTQRLIVIEMR